jgi:hypothetical protein
MALTTKPRWDKYDAYVGNFRAVLAADIAENQANNVLAVGLNSSGAVVVGAGQTGVIGVMIAAVGSDIHGNLLDGGVNNKAGDVQDIGVNGEITNFRPFDPTKPTEVVAPKAGTKYYAHADGSVNDVVGADGVLVGYTVEADRLIVHVDPVGSKSAT